MVLLILYLKKMNQPHLFQTDKFSSQPCESFFRRIRSISTVFSTVTNCSTKEFLDRVKKIQLQSNISASDSEFLFPWTLSTNQQHESNVSFESNNICLPSESEIIATIEKCQKEAIRDALRIGLIKKTVPVIKSCLTTHTTNTAKIRKGIAALNINNECSEDLFNFESMDIKNYAHRFHGEKISDTSSYVEIFCTSKRLVVKKNYALLAFGKRSR